MYNFINWLGFKKPTVSTTPHLTELTLPNYNTAKYFKYLIFLVIFVGNTMVFAATDCASVTEIPQVECEALVALYTSTNGAAWSDSPGNNWNVTNTPCSSWTGVTCDIVPNNVIGIDRNIRNLVGTLPDLSALTELTNIELADNKLTGSIPDLNILTNLYDINLNNNQLTGNIPNISLLTNLLWFYISDNQLTGVLPDLSNHSNLLAVNLANNQLDGSIPNFSPLNNSLVFFNVESNQLTGIIPSLPASLISTDLSYNLFTGAIDGTANIEDPNWATTQNIPPTGLSPTVLSDTSVQVDWTPITYQAYGGYYEIKYSTTSGGPYSTSGGITTDKTAITHTVTGLLAGTQYYFIIETYTPANVNNQNNVTSLPSAEVSVATTGADTTSFITKWETTTANETITIPTNSFYTYTYDIDCDNDGTFEQTNIIGDGSCTYATVGQYIINIRGTFPAIYIANNVAVKDKILDVVQWGNIAWESMKNAFYGASNLQVSATDSPDLGSVTDMSSMFRDATTLNSDINSWNVSNVTKMDYMFWNTTSFNQPLNSWSVDNVINMSSMFGGATSFNQPLNSWIVSSVKDMSSMFYNTSVFNQPLNSWDVSNVTNTFTMFYKATSFNQPLNSWTVTEVINMEQMFRDASAFNQDINSWDVSKVIDMTSMFWNASAFNQDLSSWDVSKVTDMTYMFSSASSFNQDISNWVVSKVTNMNGMFDTASAFNQDISSWDVSEVTDMNYMFIGASSFNQDISNWVVSKVTDMNSMFWNASAFNQDLSSWVVSNVTDMSNMFLSITLSTANYNALLVGWNSLALQSGVTFNGGNSQYTCGSAAETARTNLISTDIWTITDGNCMTPTDCTVQTDIPQTECDALVDLYTSTNGASWTDNATNNWTVTNTPCSWTGVTCDTVPGNVTVINRGTQNLIGTISDLSALTGLTIIRLGINQLTGSIPDLSALTSLKTLSLKDNQLTGSIPSLNTLTNLQVLRLWGNQLTGSIPDLSALTVLEILGLRNNQLTGSIPDLSNLTSLKELTLQDNQLTGSIPDLPASLTVTDLSYNAFNGETNDSATAKDPDWANTQTIPPTGLSTTVISDTSVQIDWTPIIYTDDVGYYEVKYSTTSGGPYSTSGGTTTDKTTINHTVTGLLAGTTYYFVVEDITSAHANNQSDVRSLPSTEVFATTTDASVCTTQSQIPVAECDTLVDLYISTDGANWTDTPLTTLPKPNNWTVTNTPCTTWTGVSCSTGQVIRIDRTTKNLVGTLPDLSALTQLMSLYFSDNSLTGTFPELSALTNLQFLHLYDNQLTGGIPDISALINLQTFKINNNQLTGDIPDLSPLVALTTLNLSTNLLCKSPSINYTPWDAEVNIYADCATNIFPPSNLITTVISETQINLSWTDSSTNETGFKITKNNSLINTTAANVTSYSNTSLTCGTTYTYSIAATNGSIDSATITATATTLACLSDQPTVYHKLIVKKVGNGTIFADYGINCGTVCEQDFADQTEVNLIATPDTDWSFTGWTGDCDKDGLVRLHKDKTCIANFKSTIVELIDIPTTDSPSNPTETSSESTIDGNGDGILDDKQIYVITIPDAITGEYITLASHIGCPIKMASAHTEGEQAFETEGYSFPQGIVYYEIQCKKVNITMYFHGMSKFRTKPVYKKFGPLTPGDLSTLSWYTLPNVIFSITTVDGKPVVTAKFTLEDGKLGDNTGIDGRIIDPGGVAFSD